MTRGPIPETDEQSSNFQKPHLDEMGSDGVSYFRKNTLDEMTVGRTEKPVGKAPPRKPDALPSPLMGEGGARNATDEGDNSDPSNSPKPIKRHKIGVGSREGEDRFAKQGDRSSGSTAGPNADERARSRKPGKIGRFYYFELSEFTELVLGEKLRCRQNGFL